VKEDTNRSSLCVSNGPFTPPSDCSDYFWGQCAVSGTTFGTEYTYVIVLVVVVVLLVTALSLGLFFGIRRYRRRKNRPSSFPGAELEDISADRESVAVSEPNRAEPVRQEEQDDPDNEVSLQRQRRTTVPNPSPIPAVTASSPSPARKTNPPPMNPEAVPMSKLAGSVRGYDKECIICYEHKIDTLLAPCGHVIVCNRCSKLLKDQKKLCPLCRAPIGEVYKAYFL
jgi:hypothetical protein